MKLSGAILVLFFLVSAAGYVRFANSQDTSIHQNEQQRRGVKSDHDAFFDDKKTSAGQKEDNKMDIDPDMKAPAAKIPPISMNVGPLLRALLERVWVTKYFGVPSEIYQISSDMPFCEVLPDSSLKQETKSGVFLWRQKCLPLEIRWKENKEDLSGTATLRMLDFDKADEVLEEAFGIIRANSLGAYKIENEKKDIIKNLLKGESEASDSKFPINYKYKLKTYSKLEEYYFLVDEVKGSPAKKNDYEEKKAEAEIRKYFSHRGKKYALMIDYNPENILKKGNVIEYSLTAPSGFFGMEKQFENGKKP